MNVVDLAVVPVTHTIKIEEASVVACDIADFLAVLMNFTPYIVLFLPAVVAIFDESCQTVLFILKVLCAECLETKTTAKGQSVDQIVRYAITDLTSILECYLTLAGVLNFS